jgi:hypothetical protein
VLPPGLDRRGAGGLRLPGGPGQLPAGLGVRQHAPETAGAPTIAFKDVGISAGTFFEGLLGDVVKEMKRVTGPLQPVMDTLYAPIPVLSDLSRLAGGGDVTLMTLAKSFSTLVTDRNWTSWTRSSR